MAEWKAEQIATEQSHEENAPGSPQLVVQQFSMEEALHNVMLANNHQIIGVYDEMSMYGQLDAYKHSGSRVTPLELVQVVILLVRSKREHTMQVNYNSLIETIHFISTWHNSTN